MNYLKAVIALLATLIVMIIFTYPADEYKPAAGYNKLYGGAVLYEYYFDELSIYTLKGVRL